jgi:hypothetical protein
MTRMGDWWEDRYLNPPPNPGAVISDGRVLVLRGSRRGWIHGQGVCDAYGRAFQFPAVGEHFEAAIKTNNQGANEPDDQHEHGIHAFWWGCTGGEGPVTRRYVGEDYLILDAAERDVVHDKRRETVGKVRVKRGILAYMGNLRGGIEFLAEHWPSDAGPPPPWQDDPTLFPPPPRNDPILWLGNRLVPAP